MRCALSHEFVVAVGAAEDMTGTLLCEDEVGAGESAGVIQMGPPVCPFPDSFRARLGRVRDAETRAHAFVQDAPVLEEGGGGAVMSSVPGKGGGRLLCGDEGSECLRAHAIFFF